MKYIHLKHRARPNKHLLLPLGGAMHGYGIDNGEVSIVMLEPGKPENFECLGTVTPTSAELLAMIRVGPELVQ